MRSASPSRRGWSSPPTVPALRLVVAVSDAAWPITVDPIFAQVAKLLPEPDLNNENASFGIKVSIDGDLMVAWVNNRMIADVSGALDIFERVEETPPGGTMSRESPPRIIRLPSPSGMPSESAMTRSSSARHTTTRPVKTRGRFSFTKKNSAKAAGFVRSPS